MDEEEPSLWLSFSTASLRLRIQEASDLFAAFSLPDAQRRRRLPVAFNLEIRTHGKLRFQIC